ncbi:hypothetical protein JW851_02355 [Candidatus Woesearchaeota archaeon]|nr:hypothetical protein [Candidatus Woesearchaeota archaeon]
MIRERTIARIFATVLLIGLICVGYVLLTQPTGMIAYQTYEEPKQKNTMSEEEVLNVFETHWEEVKEELIILEEVSKEK